VGAWSIPLAALITYFYCGLLELSKSFFDVFGREGYLEQTISVEVCGWVGVRVRRRRRLRLRLRLRVRLRLRLRVS